VLEDLPSIQEAPGSIPRITKKEEGGGGGGEGGRRKDEEKRKEKENPVCLVSTVQ
jgi:hypothetical protein